MPFANNDGIAVYYETYGAGPPFVFVHANPFDHRLWTYQIARYSQTHRVVAVDIRGYGRSDKPETPFTLADMANDVLAVCKQEAIERAAFMGCSVGSGMCLLIALDRPQMVDKLILVGGNARGGGHVAGRIAGYLNEMPGYLERHIRELVAPDFPQTPLGRWLLDLFVERAPSLSGKCIAQIFRARDTCDMTDRLAGLKIPTLVVNGEHDSSLAAGTETAKRIPGAQHVVIPGTGHACCIEDPDAFDRAVLDLFQRK